MYEQLLAQRAPLLEDAVPGAGVVLGGSGDGTSRKALRLRLLSSVAEHCRIVVREELAPGLVGQVRTSNCALQDGMLALEVLFASFPLYQ